MGNKDVVKVPVVLQMEELDGGAACLGMVMGYHRKWVGLDQLRIACEISRDGIQPESIRRAAENYGLDCRIESLSFEELKERTELPAIIVWNKTRYVVFCGSDRKGLCINHPAKGKQHVGEDEFRKRYAGTRLCLTPGEKFEPSGKKPGIFDHLRSVLRTHESVVRLVMVTSVLATFAAILSPVFTRIFTDYVLGQDTSSWYPGVLYAFAALIAFQLIASVINQILIIRAKGKVAATSSARFLRHVLYMPIDFFYQHKAGDLADRQNSNNEIAETLIGQLAPLLINLVMLVFYLVVMAQYNLLLTAIGAATVVVNLFVIRKVGSMRREITAAGARNRANLAAATISGIDMIESIKATGSEDGYFERWAGQHTSLANTKTQFSKKTMYLGNFPAFVQELSDYVVMFMGFILIVQGQFTAGLLLTFLQFLKAMMAPVNMLLDAGENLQIMGAAIERVNDVMECPEEEGVHAQYDAESVRNAQKLSGSIEIKDVTFGYSHSSEPLIENFSLSLAPGERVALVGASGSGKSTIAKMLVGIHKPWSGEILFDGQRIDEIPRAVFKGSLTMVDQQVVLFHDTIENNIKMWDETIEDFEMVISARDAGIHKQIVLRKGGYQMMVEEGGRNLSGGERQRIEIARVLSSDPSILIMDEATSALDARTEYEISEYVHARGITCIIVAHRLSTIRDCDEIIVLDRGKVVQRGTHEELMGEGGLYKQLIMTA
ncbi:MAG: ATP-binding cassette domain-containing protein [Atopobiaceae bacterium]|nr:ATP-binding cassette domain-containing protein [Atopobiaceae bacterium]